MIEYIVYGEFDINEGNVVRIEYPNKIGVSDMILSSYIIPEGTHNIMTDTFCFIINKSNNPEDAILLNSKSRLERLSENSTNYFDLEKNLKIYNIENKIYKIKQIYTFNESYSDWVFVQNIEKDLKAYKGKNEFSNSQPGTNFSSTKHNNKINFNNSQHSNNIQNNQTSIKKHFYLIIQKDKNNLFFNFDFYESIHENFIYSSNTPPPILSMY